MHIAVRSMDARIDSHSANRLLQTSSSLETPLLTILRFSCCRCTSFGQKCEHSMSAGKKPADRFASHIIWSRWVEFFSPAKSWSRHKLEAELSQSWMWRYRKFLIYSDSDSRFLSMLECEWYPIVAPLARRMLAKIEIPPINSITRFSLHVKFCSSLSK